MVSIRACAEVGARGLVRRLKTAAEARLASSASRSSAREVIPSFGIDAVEVGADGAVREVELLADLAVGEPLGRQLGDLQLLRRELIAGVGPRRRLHSPEARSSGARARPRREAERIERVARGAQRRARLGDPPLAAQPGAERELQARAQEGPARRSASSAPRRGPRRSSARPAARAQAARQLDRGARRERGRRLELAQQRAPRSASPVWTAASARCRSPTGIHGWWAASPRSNRRS